MTIHWLLRLARDPVSVMLRRMIGTALTCVCFAFCGCGAPSAPPAAAPTVTAPPAPVPSSQGAAVVELSSDRTESLGAAGRWKKIPPYLEGAELHMLPLERGKNGSELACTIRTDGVVVVAAERNRLGFNEPNKAPAEIQADGGIEVPGWEVIGIIRRGDVPGRDESTLFRREVKTGEKIEFDTKYFSMPFLIVLHGSQAAQVRALRTALVPILNLSHLRPPKTATGLGAKSRRDVVMLNTHDVDSSSDGMPILERELVRQAFLLAARDEFGLATRDKSLREIFPHEQDAAWLPFDVLVAPGNSGIKVVIFRQVGREFEVLWQKNLEDLPHVGLLEILAARCESLSRNEFVDVLRSAGLSPTGTTKSAPNPATAAAPPPKTFDIVEHFADLRRLHAEVRRAGESDELLAALAMRYAELGAETVFLWSPAHKVFEARGLLYAERLVQRGKSRAQALWTRAYVRALLGRHAPALEDLSAAEREFESQPAGPSRPEWIDVIRAHCEFDMKALKAAESKESPRPLAGYMQMLAHELEGGKKVWEPTLENVLKSNPESFRALDLLAIRSPLGLSRAARDTAIRLFPVYLSRHLPSMPGIPQSAVAMCEGLRLSATDDDPQVGMKLQVELVELLVRQSNGGPDRDEPSLGVLASLIGDAGFAQAHRQVGFVRSQLGAPADDVIDLVWPLVEDHPYEKYIAALGSDRVESKAALKELAGEIDTSELELTEVSMLKALGSTGRNAFNEKSFNNLAYFRHDKIYRELARVALHKESTLQLLLEADLREASPHSPISVQSQIIAFETRKQFDDLVAQAPEWEQKYADSPVVMAALARMYIRLHREDDALRVTQREFELAPDVGSCIRLARMYEDRDDLEHWKSTLEQQLQEESLGLEHAQIHVEFAEHYMRSQEWERALPYARAAAETWSAWGLLTASRCYKGLKDWKNSELYVRRCSERYDSSSFEWFYWCKSTGHGDVAAAERHAAAFVESLPYPPPAKWRLPVATFYYLCGDFEKALAVCVKGFAIAQDPYHGLLAALTAQKLGRRDEVKELLLKTMGSGSSEGAAESVARPPLRALAELLLQQYADATSPDFNEAQFAEIVKKAPSGTPTSLNFFAGAFLQQLGQQELSQKYLQEAASSPSANLARRMAQAALVELNVEQKPIRNKERPTDRKAWR